MGLAKRDEGTLMQDDIRYRTDTRIDAVRVRRLFKRTGFNHWFSPADVAWYLRHALWIASAWMGERCVGVVVLTGDGRIDVRVDLLVVDEMFRGRGVGSRLMSLASERLDQMRPRPYHIGVEVFERRTERFYSQFGFTRNRGTWLLEHEPTARRLRRKAGVKDAKS